jgi:hypothetical protein
MSAALTHSTPCLSDLPGAQGPQLRSATFGASARAMDIRLVSGIAPWTKMGAMELGANPLDVKPHMSLWRTQVGPHLFAWGVDGWAERSEPLESIRALFGHGLFHVFFPVQTRPPIVIV